MTEQPESPRMTVQDVAEFAFFGCLFNYDGEETIVKYARAFSEGASDDWFTNEKCRLAWSVVSWFWREGKAAGSTIVSFMDAARRVSSDEKSEFCGIVLDHNFIDDAIRYVSGEKDFSSYAEFLRNAATERALRKLIAESGSEIEKCGAVAVGNLMTQRVMSILSRNSGVKEIDISACIDRVMEGYEKVYEEVVVKGNLDYTPGLPLPWRKMAFLYNGFNPGYHIIAARPSVGKTSFTLGMMRYWMDKGCKVMFNCLDMGIIEALKRPLAEASRVSIRKAQFGYADKYEDFQRMYEAAKKIKELHRNGNFSLVQEYDVNAFKSWCVMKHAMGKLDIVVIDFIQLMKYAGSDRISETQKVTTVSGILKSIANELNIPVVALSQLRRSNEGNGGARGQAPDREGEREPELSDLRSSGAIEQDAYTVTFLYRDAAVLRHWKERPPEQYAKDPAYPAPVAPIWVCLKKNQNGDTGKLPFVVFQNTFSWHMGDYQADKTDDRTLPVNINKFARIYDDWRHNPIEELIAKNGALISQEAEKATEQLNRKIKLEERRKQWEARQGRIEGIRGQEQTLEAASPAAEPIRNEPPREEQQNSDAGHFVPQDRAEPRQEKRGLGSGRMSDLPEPPKDDGFGDAKPATDANLAAADLDTPDGWDGDQVDSDADQHDDEEDHSEEIEQAEAEAEAVESDAAEPEQDQDGEPDEDDSDDGQHGGEEVPFEIC